MNQRKGRPSFLRPLTQIAPLETPSSDLGPTTRGSIAYASQGTRPRSKSLSGKGIPVVGHATPTASISRGASPVSSAASSRRSSFVGHRRPSMVAREATMSRRDSIWSTFGDEAVPAGGEGAGTAVMTQEEKAVEARKAFVSAIKVIWDSGVSRIVQDLWESVGSAWTAGDIAGTSLPSLAFLSLLVSWCSPYPYTFTCWTDRPFVYRSSWAASFAVRTGCCSIERIVRPAASACGCYELAPWWA